MPLPVGCSEGMSRYQPCCMQACLLRFQTLLPAPCPCRRLFSAGFFSQSPNLPLLCSHRSCHACGRYKPLQASAQAPRVSVQLNPFNSRTRPLGISFWEVWPGEKHRHNAKSYTDPCAGPTRADACDISSRSFLPSPIRVPACTQPVPVLWRADNPRRLPRGDHNGSA